MAAGVVPVPGYPGLRYVGGAAAKPGEQQVSPTLLGRLQQAANALGRTIDIFSGSGGPDVRGAGFAGDPHSRGVAVDAQIDGQPIGAFPGAVAVLHSLGLRSGATDFSYQGRPDPAHVDLYPFSTSGSRGATSEGAKATGSSIDSPDTFWYAVETKLGLPHSRATHAFLQGWANVENTKARYNPLATTQPETGATDFNSVGVKNYPTPDAGVQATADTIKQYPAILAVLKGKRSPYGNPQFNAELNKWSGQAGKGSAATPYVTSWLRQAQGNPSGRDATDWMSYDIKNLGHDVAKLTGLDYLAKLFDTHNILRGLQVVAGAVLVLVGVVLLARQVGLAADVPAPPSALPVPVPVP